MSGDREALLVELVDEQGVPTGSTTVADAHQPPDGRLHRAFSVVLFDDAGRILLQQRAATKTRFAGRWSNACCGHPPPEHRVGAAATARLAAELGVAALLTEVGVYRYQAPDVEGGMVENEWDHVLIGTFPGGQFDLDPAEVDDIAWVDPDDLRRELAVHPDRYSPWLSGVIDIATN